jgi:hypothetical protein
MLCADAAWESSQGEKKESLIARFFWGASTREDSCRGTGNELETRPFRHRRTRDGADHVRHAFSLLEVFSESGHD